MSDRCRDILDDSAPAFPEPKVTQVFVDTERIRAMLRWLLDEGHITPMGVRQIEKILDGDA